MPRNRYFLGQGPYIPFLNAIQLSHKFHSIMPVLLFLMALCLSANEILNGKKTVSEKISIHQCIHLTFLKIQGLSNFYMYFSDCISIRVGKRMNFCTVGEDLSFLVKPGHTAYQDHLDNYRD